MCLSRDLKQNESTLEPIKCTTYTHFLLIARDFKLIAFIDLKFN